MISVAELLILVGIPTLVGLAIASGRGGAAMRSLLRGLTFRKVVGIAVGGLLFVLLYEAREGHGLVDFPPFLLMIGGFFIFLAWAWLRQFSFLMRLGDDAFPGRYDKIIWAMLLIALPPVGTLVFWSYRQAHWPATKPERVEAIHELA